MGVGVTEVEGINDEKIEKVLEKLLHPQFKVKSDAHLNLLFTHISKYQGNDRSNDNLTNTISCWIMQAIEEWESTKQSVALDIFVFTLNLASFISEEQPRFLKLNSLNAYERLLSMTEEIHSRQPIFQLGFITLISAFLKHKSGLQWIMSTNYWFEIISISLNDHNINVTSAGCKFIANLLEKTFNLNKTYCQNVIKSILDPLDNVMADERDLKGIHLVIKNKAIAENLCPTLKLLTDLLCLLLESTNIDLLDFFINGCELVTKLKKILLISQSEEFEFEIRNIIYLLDFVDVFNFFSEGEEIKYEHVKESRMTQSQETFKELIEKGYSKSVLKLCFNGFIFWRSIKNKMPSFFDLNRQIELENQFLILQLIPVLTACIKMLGQPNLEDFCTLNGIRDDFVCKVLKITSTRTIQMGYMWRNYLLDHETLEIYTTSLMYILKSKLFYTRQGGVIAFQAFMYCLKDIINHLKEVPGSIQLKPQENKFVETLLEAVEVFILEFNITWKDSIESMCCTVFTVELLHFSIWPPKVVTKALSLLNITIIKYLSPGMALLILDNLYDKSLKLLGTLLYSKCHDPFWQVRDGALELLHTISFNAYKRFPLFQNIILEAELPHLMVNMAIKDAEPCVRASALRCLQEMVQVRMFWDNLTKTKNIHEIVLNIVYREHEGIIRKEATTLICKIYENQKQLIPDLYEVMTNAAISDLNWEVRINALSFWKSVITNHLEHQGMIDGTFPSVTFSKEHRKIVILNKLEVKKRLIKVLNQLSEIGCLGVFIAAIQDDCDVEVSRSAIANISEFISLLKGYEINAKSSDLSSTPLNSRLSSSKELLNAAICNFAALDLDSSPRPRFSKSSSLPFQNSSDCRHPVATECNSDIVNNISNSVCSSSSSSSSFETNQDIISSIRAADVTDDILDDILKSSGINVLSSLYNPSCNSLSDTVELHKRLIVPPSEFINFAYRKLGSDLSKKMSCLSAVDDFGSLLDDILKDKLLLS